MIFDLYKEQPLLLMKEPFKNSSVRMIECFPLSYDSLHKLLNDTNFP